MRSQCIEVENEYREWRESSHWYCVKTTLHNDGRIESEVVTDEKTQKPIVIKDTDKPLDGVFETTTATIYYSYHAGYKEAMRQVNIAKAAMRV